MEYEINPGNVFPEKSLQKQFEAVESHEAEKLYQSLLTEEIYKNLF